MIVDIDNRQNDILITEELKKIVYDSCHQALAIEGIDTNKEISVSFVSEEEIQSLNKEFRGVDQITDVLSFPLEDDYFLGDIIICGKRAFEQKDELGHDLYREVSYLTVHSVFHLLGYDHMNEKDKEIMRRKEKETMDALGIYKDPSLRNKNHNFLISFSYAMDGIIHAFKYEANFRFHMITAVLTAILSLLFDLSRVEMAVLSLTVSFVLFAEIINTSIENVVDLVYKKYNPYAKIAKDVAAGAVLISAFNALFVGYFIFYNRLVPLSHTVIFKLQSSPIHLSFIALVLVVLITIIMKALFDKGDKNYLQGGTVSGHSAVAFCAATIISFIASNTLVSLLALALAFLVAEARVEGKIHSLSEVILGGLLGVAIASVLFKLFI